MEYLELVLLILLVASAYQYGKGTKELQDKVDDLEGKLDGVEKLLVELQPKGPVEIPARLDDEVINEIMDVTKQDMEEYQAEKAEFQKKMKEIEEKYKDEKLGVYDKDDIEEMKVWDATLMDGMDDNQYGNEGDTFSLYEDEQLKKIRKHVQERKKQSLNK
jgi:hypothetical protein